MVRGKQNYEPLPVAGALDSVLKGRADIDPGVEMRRLENSLNESGWPYEDHLSLTQPRARYELYDRAKTA